MADEEFKKSLGGQPRGRAHCHRPKRPAARSPTPVWFVRDSEKLYLVPVRGSDSDWYKNVLKTPTIRLAAEGVRLDATVTPISDAANGRAGPRRVRAK